MSDELIDLIIRVREYTDTEFDIWKQGAVDGDYLVQHLNVDLAVLARNWDANVGQVTTVPELKYPDPAQFTLTYLTGEVFHLVRDYQQTTACGLSCGFDPQTPFDQFKMERTFLTWWYQFDDGNRRRYCSNCHYSMLAHGEAFKNYVHKHVEESQR